MIVRTVKLIAALAFLSSCQSTGALVPVGEGGDTVQFADKTIEIYGEQPDYEIYVKAVIVNMSAAPRHDVRLRARIMTIDSVLVVEEKVLPDKLLPGKSATWKFKKRVEVHAPAEDIRLHVTVHHMGVKGYAVPGEA